MPVINSSGQDADANSLPNKIVKSAVPELVSSTMGENKTKSEENIVAIDNSQISSLHTTISPSNPTTVSTTIIESTAKQIPSTTMSPIVNTVMASSLASDKWVVNGTNNTICIVVQMSVHLNVSYNTVKNKISFKEFDIPDNAVKNATKAYGTCGEFEQTLTLMWPSKNNTNGSMTLHFKKNATQNHYFLQRLLVVLPVIDFPNSTLKNNVTLVHETSNFTTALSDSYRCMRQQTLYFNKNVDNNVTGYLTVSNLQFQAFRTNNSTVFGLAQDCTVDTPDSVPIAVGCILTGLVILVLIAYLCGRQRQTHNYVSM
ncbi:lysosome-associated membrane glycoprotein 1 isoform X2 [Ptiloglossa arizonensis]